MKKSILLILFLIVSIVSTATVFDAMEYGDCNITVWCHDCNEFFYEDGWKEICVEGWGFCFRDSFCLRDPDHLNCATHCRWHEYML